MPSSYWYWKPAIYLLYRIPFEQGLSTWPSSPPGRGLVLGESISIEECWEKEQWNTSFVAWLPPSMYRSIGPAIGAFFPFFPPKPGPHPTHKVLPSLLINPLHSLLHLGIRAVLVFFARQPTWINQCLKHRIEHCPVESFIASSMSGP